MAEIIIAALFGLLGGTIRAVVGILKYYRVNKKNKKLKIAYLLTSLILAAAIGAVTSLSITTNHLVNLVVGYAGIDFLESLVKITTKKQ